MTEMSTSYNGFIASLEFREIRVPKLYYKFWGSSEGTGNWVVEIDNKVSSKKTGVGDLRGDIRFEVKVVNQEFPDTKLFEVKGIVEITYSYDPAITITKDMLSVFEARNIPLNGWPYVRELVSNATLRMGVRPLVLPPFRVP